MLVSLLVPRGNLTHWTGWSPLFNYLEHVLSLVELYQSIPGSHFLIRWICLEITTLTIVITRLLLFVNIEILWNKAIGSPFQRLRVAQQCTSRSLLVTSWCAAGHLVTHKFWLIDMIFLPATSVGLRMIYQGLSVIKGWQTVFSYLCSRITSQHSRTVPSTASISFFLFLFCVSFEGFQPIRQLNANDDTSNQPRPCSNSSHATQSVPHPTSLPYRPSTCRPTYPLTRLEN